MITPELLFSLAGVIGIALVLFLFIYLFRNRKILRADADQQAEIRCNTEFVTQELRATVLDQTCEVKLVGTKTPKATKIFTVVFRTEDDKVLSFHVPEEMYDGFEKGQTGVLTVVDGELYGFAIEE